MVYRGKPSTACAECRKLRSRCDKKRPACGQCIKAGRGCSGYRSTVDLMFLDESTRVASQNQSNISSQDTDPNTPRGKDRSKGQPAKRPVTEFPRKLAGFIIYQLLNDLGVKFLMTNFIVDDPVMLLLHYLPSFYAKVAYSDPTLPQICAAVGLVGLVNKSHNREMLSVATNNYGAAIRAINTALSCTKTAVKDCTFASIYLAAMFETLVPPRRAGMDNASIHLAGAVSVAHLILKQQKQTDVTMKLCNTLIKTVVMHCWIEEVPLPPNFVDFKRLVEKKSERVLVCDSFLNLILSLLQFKEDYQDAAKADPIAIIQRALAIDANLDEYALDLAQKAPFEQHQLLDPDDSKLAHKSYNHLYPQHLHAQLWKTVRTTHIRLHQAIIHQCDNSTSSSESSAQRASSKALVISTIMKLLASVPQLAGYIKDIHQTPSSEEAAPRTHQDSSSAYSTQNSIPQYSTHSLYHILYQLYMHGSEPCLPQFIKDWNQQRQAWL